MGKNILLEAHPSRWLPSSWLGGTPCSGLDTRLAATWSLDSSWGRVSLGAVIKTHQHQLWDCLNCPNELELCVAIASLGVLAQVSIAPAALFWAPCGWQWSSGVQQRPGYLPCHLVLK